VRLAYKQKSGVNGIIALWISFLLAAVVFFPPELWKRLLALIQTNQGWCTWRHLPPSRQADM